MINFGKNLYCNFKDQQIGPSIEQKVRAVVMGHCGNGKTNFINNMCNTKHPTKIAGGSLTRDIAYQDVVYVEQKKFTIYDTPGSNSYEKAYEHAQIIRASLTRIPINMILLHEQLNKRYDQTIANIFNQLKIFKGYEHLVVLMVSHLDILDRDPQKEDLLNKFHEVLTKFKIKFRVVLYSNINSEFSALAKTLYKIGRSNKFTDVVINDASFYKYFNISSGEKGLHQQQINNYIQQIHDLCDSFVKFSKDFPQNSEDNDEVIAQLKIQMKHRTKQLQWKQYAQYSQSFQDSQKTTDLFLMISQLIQSKLQKVEQICQSKTKKVFYEDQYEGNKDLRDMFRQCPNPKCKLIWMKVVGCDMQTTCGKRPGFYDYIKNTDPNKYKFVFENGKLKYKKTKQIKVEENEIKKYSLQAQKKKQQKKSIFSFFFTSDSSNIKQYGCGAKINWSKEPRIQNIQNLLKELYKVSNYEQIKLQVQQLKKQNQTVINEINAKVEQNIKVMDKSKSG